MNEYYYGKLAGTEWKLLADKRILVFSAQKGWRAFDSISEADTHYADPGPGSGKDSAYFWENGQWNEVDFLFEGTQAKVIKGFSPVPRPMP